MQMSKNEPGCEDKDRSCRCGQASHSSSEDGACELRLQKQTAKIRLASIQARERALARWDSLCKPLGGLGELEKIVADIAGMRRGLFPGTNRRCVVIMAADNGVVAEGVSQCGSEVTEQVMRNMAAGISSVALMSRMAHADVLPVNIGMLTQKSIPGVRDIPVRRGTGDIAVGPAMTREECAAAVLAGIEIAEELAEQGTDLLIAGEMGIGNTTTSAACLCALFSLPVKKTAGRGAGLSAEGLLRKQEAIRRALQVNHPDPSDPLDVLSKVGGLDIAGMTGVFLGGALHQLPVMIDGLISGVAACFAAMLAPASADYMIATHKSAEPAAEAVFNFLKKRPVLDASLHLGEGTGAVLALSLLDQAVELYRSLPTFEEGSVEKYKRL